VQGTVGDPEVSRQKIGRQIVLPFSRAFEIAWKSIRIRIWRSFITMSGIVLAIAFLMSVWTSGVFANALRDVPQDHELYPMTRSALEAQALESGGLSIHCAIVEDEESLPAGTIAPGMSMRLLLKAQGKFRADDVPADSDAIIRMLNPEQPALPDAVILVGPPQVVAEAAVAEAIGRYVRDGGFLLVYGAQASVNALDDLMPATVGGDTFSVSGAAVTHSEHLAARGVPWQNHPQAQLVVTKKKGQAEVLAAMGDDAVVVVGSAGRGAVAWYPVSDESAVQPDVVSWFQYGRDVSGAGEGDPNAALLIKLIAYGCQEKLMGTGTDQRGSWLVTLSLLVCVVGITNAMLMSVTERYKEIGTMKCLGALDKFIVKLFLIESSLQGVVGSLLGAVVGFLLAFLRALFAFHVTDLETGQGYWLAARFFPVVAVLEWFVVAVVVGVILSVVAAIYPAQRAARMAPVEAMRVEA